MSIFGAGHEVVTSSTRPASPTAGQIIFETDTASVRWYTGSAWVGMIPVGTIQPFAGATAPVGWLLCYGQSLNATSTPIYNDLWSVIGTTYGGTAITAFSVPDLRGRAPYGKDNMGGTAASRITSGISGITGTTLGGVGGSEALHAHTHTQNAHGHGWTGVNPAAGTGGSAGNYPFSIYNDTATNWTGSTGNIGGTTATNQTTGTGSSQNMPPTIITNYIIKY